eukprot:TRINITY_DN2524_c0_g3_i2.p2 TRINITY_DN2524_c0_g3~~TRINITY_DN2524_c0_g3_i2.p2  ORF type:complete len:163 (+),score=36.87 TRINITY_DN2524_c0_g3_i2:475-963(+)
MAAYGPLAVIVYAEVKKHNLFKITNASFFLEELIEFYMDNAQKISEDETAIGKLHLLVSLFPSTEYLAKLLPTRTKSSSRDMVLIKLLLDIMAWYYKATERPLFTKLQKEIIPLALTFYRSISKEKLKEINVNLLSSGCSDGKAGVKAVSYTHLTLPTICSV